MKRAKELKIFRKSSIEYLKKMYRKSVDYVFDKNTWKSTAPDSYGKSKILLHTRKSLMRVGNELKIFRSPSIVGIKIIYHISMAYLFDSNCQEYTSSEVSEDNYLLRDLSGSSKSVEQAEKELKIFRFPNIEYLERLYFKSIGKSATLTTSSVIE